MFSKLDGPTSLRADLVRALAFSLADVEQDGPDGTRLCKAAVAGIWNGDKGVVVVLLRQVEPAAVARYRFSHPIHSEGDLAVAVESGLGFALSLGFLMDDPEFRRLGEAEQTRRVARWDELRKVHKPKRSKAKHEPPQPSAEPAPAEPPPVEPPLVEPPPAAPAPIAPEPVPVPSAAPAPVAAAATDAAGKTVLARIALSVRGLDPLGRLLSFF